jgi:hypothetical protein
MAGIVLRKREVVLEQAKQKKEIWKPKTVKYSNRQQGREVSTAVDL